MDDLKEILEVIHMVKQVGIFIQVLVKIVCWYTTYQRILNNKPVQCYNIYINLTIIILIRISASIYETWD